MAEGKGLSNGGRCSRATAKVAPTIHGLVPALALTSAPMGEMAEASSATTNMGGEQLFRSLSSLDWKEEISSGSFQYVEELV
jgi:hypothetical protein